MPLLWLLYTFVILVISRIHSTGAGTPTNYKLGGPDGNIRIYLINLDRRHERLQNCDKQLKHFGLNYTRFAAYDAHAIKHREYDKIPPLHPDFKFNLKNFMEHANNCEDGCGPVGCWLSHTHLHLQVMEDYRTKGIDGPVLFLEDDIRIEEHAVETINAMINTLPDTWELLAVGYKNQYCNGPTPHTTIETPKDKTWCRARLFLDTHAYIMRNATAIGHFLQYENVPSHEAIDLIWVPLNENMMVESYLLLPNPVIVQNKEFISDITPEKHGQRTRLRHQRV